VGKIHPESGHCSHCGEAINALQLAVSSMIYDRPADWHKVWFAVQQVQKPGTGSNV
jgi:hypothetical protein